MVHYKNGRLTSHLPRHWSHLGDTLAAVGVIAFTLASLLIVDLGLNWRELTTRRD
jgi:NTP pyrophosphatase (non-canonical NTP hydrolase)